jgi:diguanylate cyclase
MEPRRLSLRASLWAGRRPAFVATFLATALLGGVAHLAHTVLGVGGGHLQDVFDWWLYCGLILVGAIAALFGRGPRRSERAAWILLGLSFLVWNFGEVYYWRLVKGLDPEPYPTLADYAWTTFYPLCIVGLILLVRSRVERLTANLALDGLIAGLCVGAIGAAYVLPPIAAEALDGGLASATVTLFFPITDMILIAIVVWAMAQTGWRPGWGLGAVGVSIAAIAATDGYSYYLLATSDYINATVWDSVTPLAMLTVGWCALRPSPGQRPVTFGWGAMLFVPSLFALAATALLVVNRYGQVNEAAVWLAAATLVAVMARAALTFRENVELAESRVHAITDQLTGLANRRRWYEILDQRVVRGQSADAGLAVLLIDLDGFKAVNDNYGHDVGDALLRAVSQRMTERLRDTDLLARLGGDEFAVVASVRGGVDAAITLARSLEEAVVQPLIVGEATLSPRLSIGVACLPEHGDNAAELMRQADAAMYAAKAHQAGPVSWTPALANRTGQRLTVDADRVATNGRAAATRPAPGPTTAAGPA